MRNYWIAQVEKNAHKRAFFLSEKEFNRDIFSKNNVSGSGKMARPKKAGLDYFPCDCIADRRMELIEAEFGLTGYAVILKIYGQIFVEEGYYCLWTSDEVLMFARKNSIDTEKVSKIVKVSLERGIFDKGLYEQYSILTSAKVQEIYIEATARRKEVFLYREYLLTDCTQFPKYVYINSINADINSEKVYINPQSKVKESKVKKSKGKESKAEESKYAVSIPLKDGSLYQISEDMVNQLQQLYSKIHVMQSLRKMADFLYNNPQKRRDYSAMENYIHWWLEQDNNKLKSETPQENYPQQQEHQASYDISILDGIGLLD